jgi:hypothetical protein
LAKGELDHKTALAILGRFSFLIYWIFDNLSILGTVKVVNVDVKKMNKYASTFWFVGIIFNIISSVTKLAELSEKQQGLKRKENSPEIKRSLQTLQKQKFGEILNLVKFNGDLIPASNGSQISTKLGINFTETHCGVGGFISAIISMYQAY